MKKIKLSGRETAVLRAIDFSTPTTGTEIMERSQLQADDLADVLNGLIEVGYVECVEYRDAVTAGQVPSSTFEVNPSYAQELREAMIRRY